MRTRTAAMGAEPWRADERGASAALERQRAADGHDRGAASIFLLAVGLVLVLAGLAGTSVGTARVGRHEAHNAADLAALAGAADAIYGEGVACVRAERFAAANGGRTTSCAVDGLEVVVWAEVEVRPMPGMVRRAAAGARAGPIYGVVG
ncbi:Rv3654c family TadE-like protein [Actinoplanes sp. CA-030573]|uniref:Rv3654c family TadE-like protein n=1 Tax=Actinoplanes sp. CA-030573 TaxID=3239898 RepID=UPI003D8E97D3